MNDFENKHRAPQLTGRDYRRAFVVFGVPVLLIVIVLGLIAYVVS